MAVDERPMPPDREPAGGQPSLTKKPCVAKCSTRRPASAFLTAVSLADDPLNTVTLDPEAATRFAEANQIEGGELHTEPKVIEAIQAAIDELVNPQFARVEQVRKFTLLPRPFTVEGGEMTPTLKLKRKVICDMHLEEIEAMYDGE